MDLTTLPLETLASCPVCGGTDLKEHIQCRDYTVSKRYFHIVKCGKCSFVFTNPRPKAEDIGHFYKAEAYISHSDTSRTLIYKLYHKVRKRTLKQKLNLISRLNGGKTGKILDVGCGTGYFLQTTKEAGWDVAGIEVNAEARAAAISKVGNTVLDSVFNENRKGHFNVITLWHVLEHLHLLNETMEKLKELCADNGRIILALPNIDSIDSERYGEFWDAYDVPRHLYHFNQKSIRTLAEKHGMSIEETLPMKFDAYYVNLLSEKYKGTSWMNYPSAFFTGWKSNRWAKRNSNNYSSLTYILRKK